MKNLKLSILFFLLVVFTISIHHLKAQPQALNPGKLEEILTECGDYCEKLSHLVLYFVCREEITERINLSKPKALGEFSLQDPKKIRKSTQSPGMDRNVYIYDYQLIRRENDTKEQRILLEENGQEKNEPNAPLKTKRFKHTYMVFGPIGLLSKYNQQFYDYRVIKQTKLNDVDVFVIEAVPKSDVESEKLFGKIWIKRSDYSIQKIEWNQTSLGNYGEIEKIARNLNAIPQITLMTEFDFEKNNIRFPSKFSLEEEYIRKEGGRYKKSELIVRYKDYKFFTVETEIKH